MQCKLVSRYLDDYANKHLTSKLHCKISSHISSCRRCAKELESVMELRTVLAPGYKGDGHSAISLIKQCRRSDSYERLKRLLDIICSSAFILIFALPSLIFVAALM